MSKKVENKKILIGKILKDTRKSLGLTQEEVSETLGLAPRYVSDIERDKTKGSIDTLVKLCNLYHVSPTFILKDYLLISESKNDFSIYGLNSLTPSEREIIVQLIQVMNKNKKSSKKKSKS